VPAATTLKEVTAMALPVTRAISWVVVAVEIAIAAELVQTTVGNGDWANAMEPSNGAKHSAKRRRFMV
jgi:hypothetical protein